MSELEQYGIKDVGFSDEKMLRAPVITGYLRYGGTLELRADKEYIGRIWDAKPKEVKPDGSGLWGNDHTHIWIDVLEAEK